MCNRYTPARGEDLELDQRGKPQATIRPPRIGPFQEAPFVRVSAAGGLEEVFGQWGMIRPGSPTRREKMGARWRQTNNCRSETMAKLATFRDAWAQGRRCLVPAWGFDEPNYQTGKNVWWSMQRADGRAWAIAGLWSEWKDHATGELVFSFTMPTVQANDHPLLSRMHKPDPDDPEKRAIVPLADDLRDVWLHGSPEEAFQALRLPPVAAFDAGPST